MVRLERWVGVALIQHTKLVNVLISEKLITEQLLVVVSMPRNFQLSERKQSALLKARSFKHSNTTSSFFVFNLSPTSR